MTSIKLHLRPSQKGTAHEGKLFVKIIHRRKIKTVPTGYSLYPGEWNEREQTVNLPQCDHERYHYLNMVKEKVDADQAHHALLLSQLSERTGYTADDVVRMLRPGTTGGSLRRFAEETARQLEQHDRYRTARAYRSAVSSLERFVCRPVSLAEIDAGLIKGFEKYLIAEGLQMNTISFYMRNLRAVYFRAVKDKLVKRQEDNPFGDVYTGVYETRRRALSNDELNRLAALEHILTERKLKQALYIFLFCFHARGMSFVDMAYLRKSDIKGNTLLYKRRKTGRWIELKVTSQMRQIIQYFADGKGEMVFPLIDPAKGNTRLQYHNALGQQNRMLAVLQQMAGIENKITTHVTRHTWATVAKRAGVDIAVISEGLGHSDIRTTYKYLASFGRSTLDKVSDKVSAVVKKGCEAA